MTIDMETRLGMRIGTFVPAEAALSFQYPDTPGGVEPTVQTYIGGVTDRESRAPSTKHPRRGVVLVEAPYADFTVLPGDLWAACDAPPAHEWVLEQIRPGGRPSPADAGGLCISAMEEDPAIAAQFNEWYNEEHMPLMDAVPGMLAARRFLPPRQPRGHGPPVPGLPQARLQAGRRRVHHETYDVVRGVFQSWRRARCTPGRSRRRGRITPDTTPR